VVVATLSRPTAANVSPDNYDVLTYLKGVTVMALSLVLSGVLGTLQEKTYKQYGSHWKEGVFYTVCFKNTLASWLTLRSMLLPSLYFSSSPMMLAQDLENWQAMLKALHT
jgi:hypothetical protein